MTDAQKAVRLPVSARSARLPVLVTLTTLLISCSWGDNDLGPWKEEVRLSDGRVIVVERYERFEVKTPIGDPGSAFLEETTIKFVAPQEMTGLPKFVMRYRPIVLDFDTARNLWFVIGVNDHACGSEAFKAGHMNSRGTINLQPNMELRLIDDQWKAVEMDPSRIGLPANLLIKRTTIDQFKVVPLSEKRKLDSDSALPKSYRQVQPHIGCR